MALVALCAIRPAHGAPADIFASSAPPLGGDPPKATALEAGDTTVSTQTGALQYSYPIHLPPGRNGAVPKLGLSYSSQGAIYGTVAAGWTLGVPEIREDTSRGRFLDHDPLAPGGDVRADDRFVSSLAGGRRLVAVTEPTAKATGVDMTYRAQNDSSYTRYERMQAAYPFRWRALEPDGTIYVFGGATAACTNVSEGYAPLTSTTDPFGNTVVYSYSMANEECRLDRVRYGANQAAGVGDFASVDLTYAAGTTCEGNGVFTGSQIDLRSGTKIVTGTARLTRITATAFDPSTLAVVHTRQLDLGYDSVSDTCLDPAIPRAYSPVRLLTFLQETAWGVDSPSVTLPPLTFQYGSPAATLDSTATGGTPWGPHLTSYDSALSWGYRHLSPEWPSLEATLIDIDGDGLLDRVTATSAGVDGTGVQTCQAVWYRNNGNAQFASASPPINLPHLKWSHGAVLGEDDTCSLNGAQTQYGNVGGPGQSTYLAYRWIDLDNDGLVDLVTGIYNAAQRYDIDNALEPQGPFGAWPSCSGTADPCSNISTECMQGVYTCGAGICGINTAQEQLCHDEAPPQACATTITDPGAPPPPTGGGGGVPPEARTAYTHCDAMHYPWFFYKNLGNGVFATTPKIKYSPMPLESETADSSLAPGRYASTMNALLDINGDGIPDALGRPVDYTGIHPPPFHWFAFLGDGSAGFDPRQHLILARENASINQMKPGTGTDSYSYYNSGGLLDINGDGLVDQWESDGIHPPNFSLFDGLNFRLVTGTGGHVGEVNLPGSILRMGTTSSSLVTASHGLGAGIEPFPLTGYRWMRDWMGDVDGDGRVDLINATAGSDQAPPGLVHVHLNYGGNFSTVGITFPSTSTTEMRPEAIVNDYPVEDLNAMTWQQIRDFVDLDGDGLPELVSFNGTNMTRQYHSVANGPPRLMTSIDNGVGATTTVAYATMHGTTGATVNQDTTDPARMASPRSQWVVASVTGHDAFSATTSTSSYHYSKPRFVADDEGRFGFRGFDHVTTTSQSGAQTIEYYSFAPDWSGRLAKTVVVAADATTHSVDLTTWSEFSLLGGALKTYHATQAEHFSCMNGQTEAACTAAGAAAAHTLTTFGFSSYPTASPTPAIIAQTSALVQAGTAPADGDRRSTTTYSLVADDTNYRLRSTGSTAESQVAGAFSPYAKAVKAWDATNRVLDSETTWLDAAGTQLATTTYVHDMVTGNLLQRTKPVQHATSGPSTTFTYDSRKLYAASETNEAGFQTYMTYEYGTGTTLQTDGSNAATCTTGCPTGPTHPTLEQQKIRIDGLGRTISAWATTSPDGVSYTLNQLTWVTYNDAAFVPTTPASVTTTTQLDPTLSTPIIEKSEIDGHGRPWRHTSFVQGSAPADAVTRYYYNNDGTVNHISVPDPTSTTGGTVDYKYTFDSLGRAKTIRRPDSTTNPSGANIDYDGVTTTTTEVVGAALGQVGVTRRTQDTFGRLVKVEEQTQSSAWATTQYSYAPDDSVRTITDPEGVVTTLTHDFAGHRVSIARGGRTWTYKYDQNGNATSVQAPGSTGPMTDLDYTTTVAYDALDRPLSKTIGQRSLSSADQTLFGTATENFTWDIGGNQKGRLSTWRTFAPKATSPTVKYDYSNNAQGLNTAVVDALSIAGYPSMLRSVAHDYYQFGGVKTASYRDSMGGTNATSSAVLYDPRGLPSEIDILRTGQPTQAVLATRNTAGLVTKRRTDLPGAMTYIESDWTYDNLGRITRQTVLKGPGSTQVVRQDLTYFGNDDPSTLTHYLGTASRQFTYGYDLRHQLTSTTVPAGYFSAAYQYGPAGAGGAGRLTRATEATTAPPGSDVKPRDVNYNYDATDPERVLSLKKVSDGSVYASYAYDEAGNQTQRSYPATHESWDYVYDGKDQLRRATKKLNGVVQGSEEYWYGSSGDRTAVVKRDASGTKTELIWFLGETEAHYDGAGTLVHVYSHVSLGTPVARIDRTSNTATTVEFQFHGLGDNTIAAVDQGGAINASFSYAPFGEIVESTNAGGSTAGTAAHRRRLNDKYTDELTDLSYYGARYYDKTLIGWTQGDPLYRFVPDLAKGGPRRANLYQFSLSNPLRYMDPDGRDASGSTIQQPATIPEDQFDELPARRRANMAGDDWMMNFKRINTDFDGWYGLPSYDDSPIPRGSVSETGNDPDGTIVDGRIVTHSRAAYWLETGATGLIFYNEYEPSTAEKVLTTSIAVAAGGGFFRLAFFLSMSTCGGHDCTAVPMVALGCSMSTGTGPGGLRPAGDEPPPVTPTLTAGSKGAMLKEAIGHVKALNGSAQQKADLFARLVPQIHEATGAFEATRSLVDAAHVFLGRQGEGFVIDGAGNLFRGTYQTGGFLTTPAGVVPVYSQLTKL